MPGAASPQARLCLPGAPSQGHLSPLVSILAGSSRPPVCVPNRVPPLQSSSPEPPDCRIYPSPETARKQPSPAAPKLDPAPQQPLPARPASPPLSGPPQRRGGLQEGPLCSSRAGWCGRVEAWTKRPAESQCGYRAWRCSWWSLSMGLTIRARGNWVPGREATVPGVCYPPPAHTQAQLLPGTLGGPQMARPEQGSRVLPRALAAHSDGSPAPVPLSRTDL